MSTVNLSNPFTAELQIQPQTSLLLLGFVLSIHGGAFWVILALPGLVDWVQCLLGVMVIASLSDFLYAYLGYRPAKQVVTLYWREFGGWEMTTGTGQHLPVILLDTSFSSLYLSVLNVKTRKALGGQCYSVVLLPDNCDAVTRRYLRMRMKLLSDKKTKPSQRKGG